MTDQTKGDILWYGTMAIVLLIILLLSIGCTPNKWTFTIDAQVPGLGTLRIDNNVEPLTPANDGHVHTSPLPWATEH